MCFNICQKDTVGKVIVIDDDTHILSVKFCVINMCNIRNLIQCPLYHYFFTLKRKKLRSKYTIK